MKLLQFAALAAVGLCMSMSTGAVAQERHATGAIMTSPERLAAAPQAPVHRGFLPPAVDLSEYFPAVGDQLNQGSCVGWATAYAARAYYAFQVEHRDIIDPVNVPSPSWVFNQIHGDNCYGAEVEDAMQVLRVGAQSIVEYPYDDTKCDPPAAGLRARATDFRIEGYAVVWRADDPNRTLDTVKGALANGHPVVVTSWIDSAIFNVTPSQTVWRYNPNEELTDGHAFTLVGYDDATQTFKFINSWGTGWGDDGYGRMTYDTWWARVWSGHVMYLAGDPEIPLDASNFVADTFN